MLAGVNGDLWLSVMTEAPQASATKVKSHLTPSAVAQGRVSWEHYVGNALADAGAKVAARLAIPSEQNRRLASWCSAVSFTVAVRIACTEWLHHVEAANASSWDVLMAGASSSTAAAAAQQEQALQQAGHELVLDLCGRHFCTRCGLTRSASQWNQWFQQCKGEAQWLLGPRESKKVPQFAPPAHCQPKQAFPWGQHSLVRVGARFQCVRCDLAADIGQFPGMCEEAGKVPPSPRSAEASLVTEASVSAQLTQCRNKEQQLQRRLRPRQWRRYAVAASQLFSGPHGLFEYMGRTSNGPLVGISSARSVEQSVDVLAAVRGFLWNALRFSQMTGAFLREASTA